jgi:tRNA modification GTPase
MYIRDTIAAIATPLGSGGIGIVRVSGPDAEKIGCLVFSGSNAGKGGGFESHRLLYGRFIDPVTGSLIDEGMCVLMRSPRSYTRENVLELHCHGGYYIIQILLQACISSGARLAIPGEFTKRAFLNGRIDLAQAESIMDLIASQTERSLSLAQSQREGRLSHELTIVRGFIVEALALIEAHIDFPDDEVDSSVMALVVDHIKSASERLLVLVDSYKTGKVFRDGVSVLLLGRPNAGKSSLLNALSGTDRAIVSELPGTTRDLIEEVISINGLPVKIIDAAGIRTHHVDCIEQEGVRRALDQLSRADLVLFLVDGSLPLHEEDLSIATLIGEVPFFVVATKADLPCCSDLSKVFSSLGSVAVSTRTMVGIEHLAHNMYEYFVCFPDISSGDVMLVSNVRHRDILLRSINYLNDFLANRVSASPLELLSLDLRASLSALGEVTGETSTEELLDVVFSTFCIGK